MRTTLIPLLLALTVPAQAAPAVFQEGVLTLPEVLVQGAQGPALYRNVGLRQLQDGSFELRGWELVPLADVQSISVESDAYGPGTVVVVVQGFKSMECIDVEPAVVSRVGNTFHFAFAELPPPDNVRCATVLAPMMEVFGIQTTDLEPGEYEIVYGELRVSFEFHAPVQAP
jgi:hypothetical protein